MKRTTSSFTLHPSSLKTMIALLIISHSASIASGVKDLIEQMAQGRVQIAAAGGTLEGDLGTSVDLISHALERLAGADEVLVLVDMGSAIMSAEIALELSGIPFRISPAPLVEGALVAAIEATRPGATINEVAAAAERALETKGIALAAEHVPHEPPAPAPPEGAGVEITLTIKNKVGLHMRPAKDFVQTASRFSSTIRARNLSRPERPDGNAKSMIDIMKLGVALGNQIHIRADGADAQAAIDALAKLVADNFGE
ncbi:PTS-dependent dihydroxyacetone kinase phosphotransferase subunit DhaM [Oscillochloris sp. ZM17-4]|uniref:dihydroxyacetone kinase phosphoryl donor subunit DhaM n=1 Tax=Oscillochloris sp. ZM17-4 TaxID=2866714 RepID=UPI001C7306A4|nr:dihydroxyacetone kinase phosphoryl donor subunit DhaM [Oscillochloris sp. ZM17-4]MBX0326510.1 PTS-dependent dihydroxyacetone kinase phosphotransferase subunit DhaM [Oscillochloris sp. ZM17-4]